MLRERLAQAQKDAMKAKDAERVAGVRGILAQLKQRDIDSRVKPGYENGISEDEILQMLQSMIKQRRESIAMFQQGGRIDLAEKEAGEIAIIEEFLPRQLGEEEVRVIAAKVIADVGAAGPKDMGKVMAAMKSAYAGQIDFAKASGIIKGLLGS